MISSVGLYRLFSLASLSAWLFVVAPAYSATQGVPLGLAYIPSESLGESPGGGGLFAQVTLGAGLAPVFFQLDTGSPRNFKYVRADSWSDPSSKSLTKSVSQVSNAVGQRVGDFEFVDFDAYVRSVKHFAGTLGIGFFDNRCARFDVKRHQLQVTNLGQTCNDSVSSAEHIVFPVTRSVNGERILVTLKIGSENLRLVFDTGSASRDLVLFDRVVFDRVSIGEVSEYQGSAWGKQQTCEMRKGRHFDEALTFPFGARTEFCKFSDGSPLEIGGKEKFDGIVGLAGLLARQFSLDLVNDRLLVEK